MLLFQPIKGFVAVGVGPLNYSDDFVLLLVHNVPADSFVPHSLLVDSYKWCAILECVCDIHHRKSSFANSNEHPIPFSFPSLL